MRTKNHSVPESKLSADNDACGVIKSIIAHSSPRVVVPNLKSTFRTCLACIQPHRNCLATRKRCKRTGRTAGYSGPRSHYYHSNLYLCTLSIVMSNAPSIVWQYETILCGLHRNKAIRPSYLMLSKPVQDRPTLRQHPAKQGQLISANIHSVTVILLCKQNMLHVNVHLTLAC